MIHFRVRQRNFAHLRENRFYLLFAEHTSLFANDMAVPIFPRPHDKQMRLRRRTRNHELLDVDRCPFC